MIVIIAFAAAAYVATTALLWASLGPVALVAGFLGSSLGGGLGALLLALRHVDWRRCRSGGDLTA